MHKQRTLQLLDGPSMTWLINSPSMSHTAQWQGTQSFRGKGSIMNEWGLSQRGHLVDLQRALAVSEEALSE